MAWIGKGSVWAAKAVYSCYHVNSRAKEWLLARVQLVWQKLEIHVC